MRPRLKVVSEQLIGQILTEARQILSEIGIEVRGRALRQRLQDHGLKLDASGERLLFPEEVVSWAITAAPSSFLLYDRQGKPHADLGEDRVHFVPGSSGLKVLDHRTGKTRPAKTADFVEYVRLADGLEHIAYLATAFSTHDEIDAAVSDAWRLYLCLTHSHKPVVSGAFTEHGVPRMARMMALFRQDLADLRARPMSIFTITATGSFRYSEDSCQNLLDCVEWGIPVEIVPVTLMGLIAPVTPVGAAVFHTVDVLAGLTMAQIIKPGAPVLFGGAPAAYHMQSGTSPMTAIEALHLDVLYTAVAKYLNLPTQAYMALSDSKFLDAQAGAETFGSALLAALAGINSVAGPGMLDYVLVFSLEKLVFDNELCGQALHFLQSVQPQEDLPAGALVRQLLAEQHLLTAEHTLKHWPGSLHLPDEVIDRQNRDGWRKQGSPTLAQRTRTAVDRRLASYTPITTDEKVAAEMRRLIQTGLQDDQALPPVPKPEKLPTTSLSPKARRRPRRFRR